MFAEELYRRSPVWAQTALLNAHAVRIERHRYGARCRTAIDRLRASECWSRDQIREYQDLRLRAIVRIAYQRSPYYRSLFDEIGVSPGDIRGCDDLVKLPVLTKEILRASAAELSTAAKPVRGWLHGHTSGTTGSPVSMWYDRNTCIMTNAVDRRHKAWGGMRDGDWIGLFLGRVVVSPQQAQAPFWRANYIQKQVWFSSFHLSEANLGLYVAEIERRGLQFLEGYPSTMFILAKHLLAKGASLPLRAVYTSSETLHSLQRETIEQAFNCRVFDFYGLAERVIFAGDCEAHNGKHLSEEYGYTEIVDENGRRLPDGASGYLVGTSLHNTALPMLRYQTGDVSSIETSRCACGRTLLRIADVTTKAEDIVVTPDGRMISPSVLTHPFKPFSQLLKSQIIQLDPAHLKVKLVPSNDFTAEHERLLVAGLQERLGAGVSIDILVVDDIPNEPSGKFRWVISNVDHPNRFSWEVRTS